MRELLFLIWVRWLRWISAAENWFENQCLKKGTLLFGKWLFCHYLWQSQYKEKSYKRCCLFFDQFISLAIFSINRYLWSDGFFELPILSSFQINILLWVGDVYFFSYRGKRDYQSKKKIKMKRWNFHSFNWLDVYFTQYVVISLGMANYIQGLIPCYAVSSWGTSHV